MNDDEEEVTIELKVDGLDASNTTINDKTSTGSVINKKGKVGA